MKQLTSAQRAVLRAAANNIDPILHIGKDGVNDGVIEQLSDALEARELVKCTVQKNCLDDVKTVCHALSEALGAHEVQVIGRRFVLYRPSEKNPRIMI